LTIGSDVEAATHGNVLQWRTDGTRGANAPHRNISDMQCKGGIFVRVIRGASYRASAEDESFDDIGHLLGMRGKATKLI
jgi:hypothetical protein